MKNRTGVASNQSKLNVFIVFTLMLWFQSTTLAETAHSYTDLRILIDVSGSMKKTDPNNLRRPALRLLVELLPPTEQAGVWTFGQYQTQVVKQGKTDIRWKNRARHAAANISSDELFTDIEKILIKSMADWKIPDSNTKRNVILLSDGMVDVSNAAEESGKSRQRILNELLPKMKEVGAKVHTIALSENADHELLRSLAVSTDGWYEKIDNTDELSRIFLRLFEKTAKTENIPIKDNSFNVDENVSDMTVVVFHKKEAKEVIITNPDKAPISNIKHDKTTSWYHDDEFDVITVNNPLVGQWTINSDPDPDNRVKIITDIKLMTSELPNNITQGQQLTLDAHLTHKDGPLKLARVIELVKLSLGQRLLHGSPLTRPMLDDGKIPDKIKGDLVYSANLAKPPKNGAYEISVTAEGPTFQREIRHTVRVIDMPLTVQFLPQNSHGKEVIQVLFESTSKKPLEIEALSLNIPGSNAQPLLASSIEAGKWSLELPTMFAGQPVEISAKGKESGGDPFALEWTEVIPINKTIAEKTTKSTTTEPEKKKTRWPLVVALVLFVNGILGMLIIGAVLFWKKHKAKQIQEADAELKV